MELYNPWSDLEPRPNELVTAGNGGVDLTKKTPAALRGTGLPCLAIGDRTSQGSKATPTRTTRRVPLRRYARCISRQPAVTLPAVQCGCATCSSGRTALQWADCAGASGPLRGDRPRRIDRHDVQQDVPRLQDCRKSRGRPRLRRPSGALILTPSANAGHDGPSGRIQQRRHDRRFFKPCPSRIRLRS